MANYRSFTKAAHQLYVSQPTISKIVKDIEEELNVILLDRSAKTVTLTDAGKIVYDQACKIVSSFDHLSDTLDQLKKNGNGKLQLGLPPMIGVYFFSDLIRNFKLKYPDIDLQIIEHGAKKVADLVAEGKVEVGVTLEPYDQKLIEGFVFHDEPLSAIIPENNALSEKKKLKLGDLKNESFILFPEEFSLRSMIVMNCERAGFHPNIIVQSSQRDLMVKLVSKGLGITLLPNGIAEKADLSGVISLPLEEQALRWRLSMIWKKNHCLSFAARNWIDEARKSLRLPAKDY